MLSYVPVDTRYSKWIESCPDFLEKSLKPVDAPMRFQASIFLISSSIRTGPLIYDISLIRPYPSQWLDLLNCPLSYWFHCPAPHFTKNIKVISPEDSVIYSPPLGALEQSSLVPLTSPFHPPNFSNKISPLWVIHSAAVDVLQASRASVFWSFIKDRSVQTAKLVQGTAPWSSKRAAE